MATGLKSRIIVREHKEANASWAGAYKLLLKAKTIPSPIQDPSTVESTTLEDEVQTFEMGIRQSGLINAEGNYDLVFVDRVESFAGKRVDILHLYGTEGTGSQGIFGYEAQVSSRPNDIGGNDEIIGMSVAIVPGTVPQNLTSDYKVTVSGEEETKAEDLEFTVVSA